MAARARRSRHRGHRPRESNPSVPSLRLEPRIGRAAFATLTAVRSGGRRLPDPTLGDAYAILGVAPGSDDETIAAAYRTLARRHHPDVAGETGTARMTRVNAAFERIRTAARRAEYDLEQANMGARRPSWAAEYDGTGGAGPAPGRPSGSVLGFGRHVGWSIGEIARVDPGYLVWLEDRREGRPYFDEIDRTLRATGYRRPSDPTPDRGQRR